MTNGDSEIEWDQGIQYHMEQAERWVGAAEGLYDEDPDEDDPHNSLAYDQSRTASAMAQAHAAIAQAQIAYDRQP